MKKYVRAPVLALSVIVGMLGTKVDGQQPQSNVPTIPFQVDVDFLKLPPDMYLGEVGSFAINSKGNMFVYDRYGAIAYSRILEFAPDGKFIRQIGKDLYGLAWAEKIRIDNADNIWAVDGSNMVMKFSPAGRVLMVLGRKWELYSGVPLQGNSKPMYLFSEDRFPDIPPSNNGFNRPTDVAFDSQGNIYVSDGHTNFGGNARYVKFSKDGDFIQAVGKAGKDQSDLSTPHSIVIDAKDNVYVGDRDNRRVQVFDTKGNFVKSYTDTPAGALCITPGPNPVMFAGDGGTVMKLDLNSGNKLGRFGESGRNPGRFSTIHGLHCKSENEVYVAELTSWRVSKVMLRPGASTAVR
jgi:hypothetical protein